MTATPSYPGRFIVLDGVDGCGKSTQAKRLVHTLRTEGEVEVQHLRDVGVVEGDADLPLRPRWLRHPRI